MIQLRRATYNDLTILLHWDDQPHVIAANPNDKWDWELELQQDSEGREQLIAEINGRPLGFIEITDPVRDNSNYWGELAANFRAIDIWIGEETDLGKGYGTKMMHLALVQCFSDPIVTAVLVDPLASNIRAHRFYERLGFQLLSQRQFGDDDCCVYQLNQEDWHPVKS